MANPNPVRKFKKGQSGNLKGRPKNAPMVTPTLRRFMDWQWGRLKRLTEDSKKMADLKISKVLALRIIALAHSGNATVLSHLLDRIDGKAAPLELADAGYQPLKIEFVEAKKPDAPEER